MLSFAIQKVGFDYQQTEPQGATDLAGFLGVLNDFPWAAQHAEWDENQDGPLPAVILQNADDSRELWVTAFSDGRRFQLQSISMQPRKSLFGKPKLEQDATVAEADSRAEVETLCRMFCAGDYAGVDGEVNRLAAREKDRETD